jgi:hypothetical protein
MKWFGVPAGISRDVFLSSFALQAKLSKAEALGRVVLAIEWLAENRPSGVLDDVQTLMHAAGLEGARGLRIAEAMWHNFVFHGTEFWPYLDGNTALVKSRARQRHHQQLRRAKLSGKPKPDSE